MSRPCQALGPRAGGRHQETVVSTGTGWEFIPEDHHGISQAFDYLVTNRGKERWKEDDMIVQRYDLTVGCLWPIWHRAIPRLGR